MRKKERDKKSFFRRGQHHEAEDEFLIISNDELFEDVDDSNYDDEIEEDEEFSENEALENNQSEEAEEKDDPDNSESAVSEDTDALEEEASEETEDEKIEEKSGDSEELKIGDESKEQEEDADFESEDKRKEPKEDSESMTEEETDFEEDEDLEEPENDDAQEVDIEEESEKSEPTEAEIALKKHRRRKKVLIAMLCVVFVFAAAYLGVSAFFYSHFYYNTKINGVDFSLKTVDEVQEYMAGEVAGYSLTLSELGGKKEVIYGSDISLKYVKDDLVKKQLEKQNPFLWFTALWEHPNITASIGVEYNDDQLKGAMGNLVCTRPEEQTPPVSAIPEFRDTHFEIKGEEFGTQLDFEKFIAVVNEAISGFIPEVSLEEKGCYVAPIYTSESPEVIAARDAMNSYLGANITLDFTPYTEVVDATVISQWISVDENMQVAFNQDAVRGYIAGLAEKYDTYGRPRNFTTGFGNTVQIEGGTYGWLIDQETEYNALTANIQNAETVTREPNYLRRGATHEGNDFGNTYAEVDLTNQHMFYFKDGQCILQSDIVTGNPNKGHATPQGVYTLSYKAPNQVLRGKKMPDGTYEYESPVSYWMPFNGGIGFHDATWQSAFGGSRYLTYGSHGCVNMPVSAAAELYGYIEAGIPVVCHY